MPRTAITLVSPSRRDCAGPPLHLSHHPGGIAQDRHYTCLTIQEALPRAAITLVSPSRRHSQDCHYTCLTIQEELPRTAITLVSPFSRHCPGPPLHLSHQPGGIPQDRHYTCLTIQERSSRTAIILVSPSRRDRPGPPLYLSHHPGLTIPPSLGHVSLNPLNATAARISKNVPSK